MIEQLMAIDGRLISWRSQLLFARFIGNYEQESECERHIVLLEKYRALVVSGRAVTL